jgi:hypothetical protein
MAPAARRLMVLPEMPVASDRRGVDPMRVALRLFEAGTSQRERLRAAEAIRAASWLALRRTNGEPDAELPQHSRTTCGGNLSFAG